MRRAEIDCSEQVGGVVESDGVDVCAVECEGQLLRVERETHRYMTAILKWVLSRETGGNAVIVELPGFE